MPIVRMSRLADLVAETDWPGKVAKLRESDYDLVFEPRLEDEEPTGSPHVHLVDDFAAKLNLTLGDRQPRLFVKDSIKRQLASQDIFRIESASPRIAIHVGPSWPVREWSVVGWTKLVDMLKSEVNATVIQLGADQHTAKGSTRATRIPGATDMVGRLSLEQTIGALGLCSLFVGIDSGLLHASGAIGVPCVGVFGPINPVLRLPPTSRSEGVSADLPCIGCHHRTPRLHWQEGCPNDISCMAALRAKDVFDACRRLLSKQRDESGANLSASTR